MTVSSMKLKFILAKFILLVQVILPSTSASNPTSGKNVICGSTQCPFVKTTASVLVSKATVSKYEATYKCLRNETLTAELICNSLDYRLEQPVLTCNKNGSWVPLPPHNCTLKEPAFKSFFEKHKWPIVGGGSGGLILLILIVVVVVVVSLKRKQRMRKMKEALQADIDGMSNPAYGMGSVFSFTGLERRGYHKVWSCKRTRKKFIYGETLDSLLDAAAERFGCSGKVHLVLEEDGTEVDNDEILNACTGKVFLILSKSEKWMAQIDNSAGDSENRMTFDVCSYNRRIRSLILANTVKNLIHQGSTMMNYVVTNVCLEEDGTIIDDTESLFACVSKTLMLLGRDHEWIASQEPLSSISQNEMNRNSRLSQSLSYLEDRAMYKVWTEDGEQKKVVFADNVIDLHLKASRALGLDTPVKITIHGTDEEIIEDDKLLQSKDKVLDVTSVGKDVDENESYYKTGKSQTYSDGMNYYGDKSSDRRHLDETYSGLHDDVGQNQYNDTLTQEEPRYVHYDRPPGGTTTPGYRMFESSDVSLRHVQRAPYERNTPHRKHEMDLPYRDLSPSHRVHPGRIRPSGNEEIEMKGMNNSNIMKRDDYNNVLNRNDSKSYRQDMDIQLSRRPYIVTGDTPQSRKSDVLF